MRNLKAITAMLLMLLTAAIAPVLRAQPSENEDKTLSPYFLVQTDDGEVAKFTLESTWADVDIAGVIAGVTVTQVYTNDRKKPIEAIYVFPASTRAAVYGMKMTIGERVIVAKIEKKEDARQQYEQAKQEGKSASLLEQQRPNVFQMNVANIMPGDRIEVELKYTELLVPESGVYEFDYPTVVGPRYSNQSEADAPASDQWVKNPYLHEGGKAPHTFDIDVNLSAGMPIQDVTCTSHKVDVDYEGKSFAAIKLDRSEKDGGNRDFILKYRLAGGKIQSGLLLYEGNDENFFLLMVQPPERVTTAQIPPREYIFVVDVSGSMHGFPLDVSKKLMRELIGNLRRTDTFNVLLFAGGSQLMSEKSIPATRDNIDKAISFIDSQQGGGGTELLPALKRALSLPRTDNVSRTVVIATDGYVNVEKEAFDVIRDNLNKANMFTFGIGSSVNRYLLEGMARVGQGEPFVITSPDQAAGKAEKFRELIQSPVLTQIKVEYDGFKAYDVEPVSVPDVLAERPVVLFGKYRGKPKGEIKVSGISGEGDYEVEFDVSDAKPLKENAAIRYLWARKAIEMLDDYNKVDPNDERVKEVTSLGLTYNLLTAYTSFVAIDSEVRNEGGDLATIKQPLPLPEGVSDYAVGSGGGYARAMPMKSKSQGWLGAAGGAMTLEESVSQPMAPPPVKPAEKKDADKRQGLELSINKIEIDGALSESEVEKTVEAKMDSIKRCLVASSLGFRLPAGAVKVELYINAKGEVTKVKVLSNTSGPDLETCVTDAVKGLHFNASSDKQAAKITLEIEVE